MSSGTSTPTSASLSASLLRKRPYKFATQCATVENPDASHKDPYRSSQVPIYQTATFKGMDGQYDYTRSGNPTRSYLEHHIAKISSAQHAFAVTSGMGALDVILKLLKPGDEIIAGNDLYGGSNRLLTYIKSHNGNITHHVPTTEPESLLPYLTSDSKVTMVLLETPTNPLLQIADIRAIADLVHKHKPDALVVVDNTMMSPYLQRPLEHGADVVYDSGTKYLSGHHDLMAGVVTCNREDVAKGIAFTINMIGNGLPPFDAFLLLRGIKTLALRLDRQQASSLLVAHYLQNLGFKVNYPGLAGHPGKEIHDRLASGPGAVLSFETGDKELSERIVSAARLWGISVSFGCVNSLISMPCLMSHASIAPALRAERNLPEDLIRLCIGIEDPEDLIDDLEAALLEAGAVRVVDEAGSRASLERVKSAGLAEEMAALTFVEAGSVLVSAPGKVILFGEHAVVHGVTAIAGSISLRCYTLVSPRADGKIQLSLPDVSYEATWEISALPWDLLESSAKAPKVDAVPNAALLKVLAEKFVTVDAPLQAVQAAQCFLYLYMTLCEKERPSQTFTTRSALPIGAGLGSSAAYSVCLSSALLYTHSHLPLPSISSPISPDHATIINAHAFLLEKIIHGTPSGVDNTVSTLGGAIAFTKTINGKKEGGLEGLTGFKSVRFLITDSGVGRNTKKLVEGVARRKLEEPDVINELLESIALVSSRARLTLLSTTLSRGEQIKSLEELVEENHDHLVSLGVGHAVLEKIKARCSEFGLATKLTGAGGGGCTVTVLPDDFSSSKLNELKASLAADGFKTYETEVGGSGLGLSIPSERIDLGVFKNLQAAELGGWAESGEWRFV